MYAPAIKYFFKSAVAIMLRFQLCLARYTALQTKNNRRSASATIQSPQKYDNLCTPNYQKNLSNIASKVQWPLRFACSAHYTTLQMKNSVRIVSVINPFTTENTYDSHLQM